MSMWNYVVTAHQPTAATHSCVGNFTGPRDINLIIAKCTRIEIHSLTQKGLQPILDVPIYGRITALELFRPKGEQQDFLFISTEKYKFCVLQWDTESGQFITRVTGDVSDPTRRPAENAQIGIIDPDCRVIGFHLFDGGLIKFIPLDNHGQPTKAFDIRLEKIVVLDIKFLYGCSKPTIAVLYQCLDLYFHVKTFELDLNGKGFNEGPWTQAKVDYGSGMLIPVPMPLGGVIIIGENRIVYRSSSIFISIPTKPNFMTNSAAYGRVDGSRYLLGDHTGMLFLLAITHVKDSVTGLQLQLLGETSAASTISYLNDGFVYVGSSFGDSQLIKLRLQPNARGSNVEVLETFVNLGPIVDFCAVDIDKKRGGGEQIVTCSGGFKDGSLRIFTNGIRFNEKATAMFPGIKGIWSLRSSIRDTFHDFLVMSFFSETRLLAINSEDELEETEIQGFVTDARTLICQDAIHDQLVQVTSRSVRLVSASSKMLLFEWKVPTELSIIVATANETQVLLATGGGHLVYLEIGEGSLVEVKHLKIENDVACLDINPSGDNPIRSEFAAVGLWTDYSVRLYSLPNLELLTMFHFPENVPPRSVLLCRFELITYLLCGLGDGNLYNFTLNMSNGQLFDMNTISMGTQAITLTTFRSNNKTHVFASSDRLAVIYSHNRRLVYRNVQLTEVNHICSFNTSSFPDSVVIAKEDKFIVGSMGDIQKLEFSSVPLGEMPHCICHQEHSHTFALCSENYNYDHTNNRSVNNFVRLFDDENFENISSYTLDANEQGYSILNCSFTDDNNFYYCVGTSYVYEEDHEPMKGRILVFSVENGQLQLVSEKETKGTVFNLNAFHGKLLAGINEKIELYKWVVREDGSPELHSECVHGGHIGALQVKTSGVFVVVGDYQKSMYLLEYKPEQGGLFEEMAYDDSEKWMTAVEILEDDIYLGAENNFNLFTVRRKTDAAIDSEEGDKLEVEGEYHLGELVNRFRHGSTRSITLLCSKSHSIPTVIFATPSGMIGVIASLPEEQYQILHKLQKNLVKVIKGVGGLSHEQWRSFNIGNVTRAAKKFLDGDLIESFVNLNKNQKQEIASAMNIPEEELCRMVSRLATLH